MEQVQFLALQTFFNRFEIWFEVALKFLTTLWYIMIPLCRANLINTVTEFRFHITEFLNLLDNNDTIPGQSYRFFWQCYIQKPIIVNWVGMSQQKSGHPILRPYYILFVWEMKWNIKYGWSTFFPTFVSNYHLNINNAWFSVISNYCLVCSCDHRFSHSCLVGSC